MESTQTTSPDVNLPSYPGRPPLKDWPAEKATLQAAIDQGDGFLKLANRYRMSVPGMRAVLRRLGLRTKRQQSVT
jgi:hypothetical protein